MDIKFRLTRRRLAMVAAAVAVAATGSIGWAAIGDAGTIVGCVAQNGTIDTPDQTTQECRDRQTKVEWYTKAGADARFLTPPAADGAYARIGSSYTKSEADATFLTPAAANSVYARIGSSYTKSESESRYQRRGTTTACPGTDKVTAVGADGNVACGPDRGSAIFSGLVFREGTAGTNHPGWSVRKAHEGIPGSYVVTIDAGTFTPFSAGGRLPIPTVTPMQPVLVFVDQAGMYPDGAVEFRVNTWNTSHAPVDAEFFFQVQQ